MKTRIIKKRRSRFYKQDVKSQKQAKEWMVLHRYRYEYGDTLDLAIDCAYTLDLTSAKFDWEIPPYLVNIATLLMADEVCF